MRRPSLLLALVFACAPAREPARLAVSVELSPVHLRELTVAAGERLSLDARGAGSARPCLHLWDPQAGREVARSRASLLHPSHVELRFANDTGRALSLSLVARACEPGGEGEVELRRGGRPLARKVVAAGAQRNVPAGEEDAYEVGSLPGPERVVTALALRDDGALLALSTGVRARLAPRAAAARVVLGAAGGRVNLYVNDPRDRDGDGLGDRLERALHARDDLRDTDGDGLADGAEVLGVPGQPRLDLPRYGTSPLHKDVLVEVDFQEQLGDVRLREQDLVATQRLLAEGSASDLGNPDGKPGVALHVDVGLTPASVAYAGLYGAWGGSGPVPEGSYKEHRKTHFSPERRGYFRYAVAAGGGTGQTTGDTFTFNVYQHRARYFAHELGHTLGLTHFGDQDSGAVNCKPSYQSLMSYVYQNADGVGFSARTGVRLDPGEVYERAPPAGLALPPLTQSPLELDVTRDAVDWNRDGLFSELPVRAPLTFATYKSCGAAGRARKTLWEGDAAGSTPALARVGDRLVVLWVTAAGELWLRHGAVSGPDARGSCPQGDGYGSPCMTFWGERAVAGVAGLRHVAALGADDATAVLALVDARARLRVVVMEPLHDMPRVLSERVIEGARTTDAPAIAWHDEARRQPAVYFRDADGGALRVAAVGRARPVLDQQGRAIVSPLPPAVARLGTGELCAVFPDADRFIRFYCRDAERDRFVDLSARAFYSGLGPQTSGQVGLAYHRYRLADGGEVAPGTARGAVYLSYTEPNSSREPDNPVILVSSWLDRGSPARVALDFRWRGSLIDMWTNLAPGTGVALYEDEQLSALKAVMAVRKAGGGATKIDVLPLADGTFHGGLSSSNDFAAMRGGICRVLRPAFGCAP